MTCQELSGRLDEWLDGTLAAPESAEIERHLASCAACQAEVRGLRRLLDHAAALPRSLAPGRDLWPAIEARISRPRGWSWLSGWGHPAWVVAAAAMLLAVGLLAWRQQQQRIVRRAEMPAGDSRAATRVSSVSGGADAFGDPVLARAERDYESAASVLVDALRQRQASLEPETLANVEANLRVIDRALGEVRQALALDPGNPGLNRMLVATHRKKLDVLQRVVRLSTAL